MNRDTRVYDSILELLPDEENPTPMVRLARMSPDPGRFELFAKLEWMNPFGSVKDRAARALLRDLGEKGKLRPGCEIVEPTSGNTGISLAAIAGVLGHRMLAVVPDKIPEEKKILLKIAGAELEVVSDALCPSPGMGDGSINLAKTHAKAEPERYVMPNQYENEANVRAHLETTGPEIWRQTEGKITHLFASLGTCGTITGLARFFRQKGAEVKIIAVQPSEGHDVPGLRNVAQLEVSKLFDADLVDEIFEIDYELAYSRAFDLSRAEGLLAGPSAGLIYEGARRVIERDRPEGLGVMIFPDNVFKYTASMARHIPTLGQGLSPADSGPSPPPQPILKGATK